MFITNRINENLTVISEDTGDRIVFSMQLVTGNRRAALIDAGMGRDKGLMEVIRKFTDLPVILCLTHGHGDHIGNADLFDDIYMSRNDGYMFYHKNPYKNLENGQIIDLGDRELEAYYLKGHTDGTFCFLDKKGKSAFTGDAVNCETWLCGKICATAEEYALRIKEFSEKIKKYGICNLYDGHSKSALPENICVDMIAALDEIALGKTAGDSVHHIDEGREKHIHFFGNSAVIYDKGFINFKK